MDGVRHHPDDFKKTPLDRYTFNDDVEDMYKSWDNLVPPADWGDLEEVIMTMVREKVQTAKALNSQLVLLRRKQKKLHKKSTMLHVLNTLMDQNRIGPELMSESELECLRRLLVKKGGKSNSGVLVVTVLTSPYPVVDGKVQRFSCNWNCYYCPNEPGQPRSYLHDEPSVLRGNRNHFDAVLQFCDRCIQLAMNGHPVDKIELLILGGTWASYPVGYQEDFIRDLFYAANTFFVRKNKREKFGLDEEKRLNETARCKIIGITLETRPDCINAEELRRFRRYGCTRVQLGVQHTDDGILKKINRDSTTADTKHALQLLKDSCYKVDIHLMPNLPGASPDIDRKMFDEMLTDEYLHADQWKIYPCEVTPWTVIEKWYRSGEYQPYPEDVLMEVLMEAKSKVHPWIRLNRVIRDIPSQYILGGVDNPSMRQVLQRTMKARGLKCRCIRCREVRDKTPEHIELVVREYNAQGGKEYFISFESPDRETILGFARLRINSLVGKEQQVAGEEANEETDTREPRSRSRDDDDTTRRRRVRSKSPGVALVKRKLQQKVADRERETMTPFPELWGAALIRELHVYGQLIPTVDVKKSHSQHIGLGTRLMQECERIAMSHGASKIAVIAGVGVRDFYRKIGYNLEGESEMMMKYLPKTGQKKEALSGFVVFVFLAIVLYLISTLETNK
uniref:tRNA carboxymethyluridine synthase n=1 Tax=Mucochytrium quahogii TaxID=96639 RepID=A0A7S2SI95_9STRA|mmetsp:Transcript_37308/g.60663  ORF Transcript_37308/g.60663 Transcript_37308/m.60663 type:complete len:678 (+) Transcript_37308:17-2050(+)